MKKYDLPGWKNHGKLPYVDTNSTISAPKEQKAPPPETPEEFVASKIYGASPGRWQEPWRGASFEQRMVEDWKRDDAYRARMRAEGRVLYEDADSIVVAGPLEDINEPDACGAPENDAPLASSRLALRARRQGEGEGEGGVKRIYYGQAGHHILARRCAYHLHTHVGRYCISTVGEFFPDRTSRKPDTVGHERLYETKVFALGSDGEPDYADDLDFAAYNEREDAHDGHEALVARYETAAEEEAKL